MLNHAPELNEIADQQMGHNQDTLDVVLPVSDADGDSLTLTAVTVPGDVEAYNLDQTYDFTHVSRYDGAAVKYLVTGNGPWATIRPTGELQRREVRRI